MTATRSWPNFPRKGELRTIIRWQHLLNREHPTGTERKIAHTRVRMEGWRQRRLGRTAQRQKKKEKSKKTLIGKEEKLLTGIGLLMEGPGGLVSPTKRTTLAWTSV